MTKDSAHPAAVQPSLSMFDVYSGYVLTQGHNALQYVVMWERVMRAIAILALLAVAAFWLAPGGATDAQVLPLKLVLSVVLAGMAATLFWAARSQPQYESQIDLIHGEIRQVMRAASGIERQMLRIGFGDVKGLYIKRNRAHPESACLMLEISGVETPVVMGIGTEDALGIVHGRLTADLAKARRAYNLAPANHGKRRATAGMQAA
ncbi:hypothetical protein [Oceaniglobus ichthyenteri]|uniref:hypothetical protein n=1 Tax=Oceaniglobus ichthyenteri TaxID=2136177 RepID=UPI000D3D26F3|nr:hypothetical protein [Oceaniglobus ichthyenteri]